MVAVQAVSGGGGGGGGRGCNVCCGGGYGGVFLGDHGFPEMPR